MPDEGMFMIENDEEDSEEKLEYEDGYTSPPYSLEMHHLKTKEFLKPLISKVVKDIKYPVGYGCILIIFTDGTELDVDAEDCFDFHVTINPGKE